jgi:hypothetical protein
MYAIKTTGRIMAGLLLAGAGFTANSEVFLPDGNDWGKSSQGEQIAYLLGVSNTVTIGYISDEKRLPGNQNTFTHRAAQGLRGTSVETAVSIIDAWYQKNPGQLDKPVLRVLWEQIGKPRLKGRD